MGPLRASANLVGITYALYPQLQARRFNISLSLSLSAYIYIYIYIHICTSIIGCPHPHSRFDAVNLVGNSSHAYRRRVNMVEINMVLAESVEFKHGLYKSCGIEWFEGIVLEPCLLQPCFHVAGHRKLRQVRFNEDEQVASPPSLL